MNILITGATGFVGGALLKELCVMDNIHIRAVIRDKYNDYPKNVEAISIRCIKDVREYEKLLNNIDIVIHAAAKVHHTGYLGIKEQLDFDDINVSATSNLAEHASNMGVKRFIFISSVKVNGDYSIKNLPFTENMPGNPSSYYAVSKHKAERRLNEISRQTGMEIVIIRPVLVYGLGVKANFKNMLRFLYKGVILPLGCINNLRSMISIENLVYFIITCSTHKMAANNTFLIADSEDISTTDLLILLGDMLGKKAKLISCNPKILEFGLKLIRKHSVYHSLCCSLQVNTGKARDLLGWKPILSMEEGLYKVTKNFLYEESI